MVRRRQGRRKKRKRKTKRERRIRAQCRSQYGRRAAALQKLGYSSYKDYLSSSLWKEIRDDFLNGHPECFVCGKKATQVHHTFYRLDVLAGETDFGLKPVCRPCHRSIEFTTRGEKLPPLRATEKAMSLRGQLDTKG